MTLRIVASVAVTIVLWFFWWAIGFTVAWSVALPSFATIVVDALWWIGLVAIPVLVWFTFRHV